MTQNHDTPPLSGSSDRGRNWLAKWRWFAAEIVVVVAGVLIALTLNAWWDGQQDREREQVYLHQLAADLSESERLIQQADSLYQSVDRRGALLVRAFRLREMPSRDSVTAWIAGGFWHEPLTPVTATAEALVFTGDITLIRNDSLRAEVTRYVSSMNKASQRQQVWSGEYYRAVDRLSELVDFIGVSLEAAPRELVNRTASSSLYAPFPPDPVEPAFSYDTQDLFSSKEAYRALWTANNWKSNLAGTRAEMLNETRALRVAVRREILDR